MSALAHAQEKRSPTVTAAATATGLLQRKCACGGVAGVTGECAACRKKRLGLQAKLAVNEPGDVYEQEADRVAARVMSMPVDHAVSTAPLHIQRVSGLSSGRTDDAPASVDRALASVGSPLDSPLREEMERRFGHDFSRVRVHSGAAAEQSVREVNARAYTVGNDIVFDRGQFAPATRAGRGLLAHELTHVVQQRGSDQARRIQRQPRGTLYAENLARRDGVPLEKWSEQIEEQYRRRGEIKRAQAMRACRREGLPACNRILTATELQSLYDRNITPAALKDLAASAQRGNLPSPGAMISGAVAIAVAPKFVPPPVTPTVPWGTTAANTNAAVAETAAMEEVAVGSEMAVEGVPAAGGVGAGALAGPAALAAAVIIPGVHWYRWSAFQDKWIAAGYVLLEDPLRVCISGCHHAPVPRSPLPDEWESPLVPIGPSPFSPGPRQLPPGYTELTPFEPQAPDVTLGRATPRVKPKPGPTLGPKPTPRPDDDDDRRKKQCEPHLYLPAGKTIHTERYGWEIRASRLKSAPTSIQKNRLRTSAYERSSSQIPNWNAGIRARMSQKILDRGATLGISRERILLPNWGPDGKFKQMDVDHIIELQVGWEREEELDRLDNYELLDASTNSSVGPTLDAGIQKERARLKQTCPTRPFNWDEVPLVFTLPMFPAGGKGPGERWTVEEILKGKHLDVYPRRPRK